VLDAKRGLSPPQRLLLVNTSERKRREARALELSFFPLPSPCALFPKCAVTVGGLCGGERKGDEREDS